MQQVACGFRTAEQTVGHGLRGDGLGAPRGHEGRAGGEETLQDGRALLELTAVQQGAAEHALRAGPQCGVRGDGGPQRVPGPAHGRRGVARSRVLGGVHQGAHVFVVGHFDRVQELLGAQFGRAPVDAQGRRGTGVGAGAPAAARRVIGDGPHDGVPEAVVGSLADGPHQVLGERLVESGARGALVEPRDGGGDDEVEGVTEHGGGAHHGPPRGAEPLEVVERGRGHPGRRLGRDGEGRLGAGRGEREQQPGVAAAAAQQGQPGAVVDARRHERGELGVVQGVRGQLDAVREAAGGRVGEQGVGAVVELARAVGDRDEHGPGGRPLQEVAEQVERVGVGAVQIVEDQQQAALTGEFTQQTPDGPALSVQVAGGVVVRHALAHRGEQGGEPLLLLLAEPGAQLPAPRGHQVVQGIEEQSERRGVLEPARTATGDGPSATRGTAGEVVQAAGFAAPGVPCDLEPAGGSTPGQ